MPNKSHKHPILVPVDFSHHSEAALIKACEMAQCMKLPIIALHVVHDPGDMPGYYASINKKNSLVRIEDLAMDMFEDFMKAVKKRHPKIGALRKAKTMLVVGLPVTKILQVSEKLNASMVVMGSQGRTGLDHMLLGSKAEQIVRLSPVPVTIFKA
ncbi:MAG: universal stress protein [endosymbiont of Escarpia spicata]|uniref:Universal stress protein n=1 Tax=endosymbiont of Escarpia spicata TaxID=2200908 RepID=A0A370DF36_9GAMM|nr:MAG: universal stress protein [endosymbiont of Escarpia spicata]